MSDSRDCTFDETVNVTYHSGAAGDFGDNVQGSIYNARNSTVLSHDDIDSQDANVTFHSGTTADDQSVNITSYAGTGANSQNVNATIHSGSTAAPQNANVTYHSTADNDASTDLKDISDIIDNNIPSFMSRDNNISTPEGNSFGQSEDYQVSMIICCIVMK